MDDELLASLAHGIAGKLGGKVGMAPRLYLKRLIGLLDQVDERPDFDRPRRRKFVPCRPEALARALLVPGLLDVEGARRAVMAAGMGVVQMSG